MSELQNKLDKVISDIEKRITNKEDFEYVKTQIYNIYTIFLDEFDKLEAKCNEKMEDIFVANQADSILKLYIDFDLPLYSMIRKPYLSR